MNDLEIQPLRNLRDLDLITKEEYERALESDVVEDLLSEDDEAGALFRLIVADVVAERDLNQRISAHEEIYRKDPGSAERQLRIMVGARIMLEHLIGEFGREHMETLLQLGLIDAEQCEEGCTLRPIRLEGVIDSPARALAMLVNRDIVTESQFAKMKLAADNQSDDDDASSQIVRESAQIQLEMVTQALNAMPGRLMLKVVLWGMLAFLVFVFVGWIWG